MKIRNGFVSNSSSSSFIIVKAGNKTILEDGDTEMEECGSYDIDIDDMISDLVEAKNNGATKVFFIHGGGYDG